MAITKIVDDMRTTTALDGTKISGAVPSGSLGNAVAADDSITLAKMASGTDGQVITYSAAGDPVAIGPGTAGQVLTSAGANLPQTFADAGGGAWSVLPGANGSGNLSAVNALAITGITKTTKLFMHFYLNTTASIRVYSSANAGSSYDSGSGLYAQNAFFSAAGTTSTTHQPSESNLVGGFNSFYPGAAYGISVEITIHSPAETTYTIIEIHSVGYRNSGPDQSFTYNHGLRKAAAAVNALQVSMNSSATMTGKYTAIELN